MEEGLQFHMVCADTQHNQRLCLSDSRVGAPEPPCLGLLLDPAMPSQGSSPLSN